MNKKLLAATLPLLGGAVIVGAGFGAWAFTGETAYTASVTGTVDVTDLISDLSIRMIYEYQVTTTDSTGGSVTTNHYAELTSFNLELDQGELYNTEAAKGITPYVVRGTTNYEITHVAFEVFYSGTAAELTTWMSTHNVTLSNFSLDFTTGAAAYAIESYADLAAATKTAFTNAGPSATIQDKTTDTSYLDTGTGTADYSQRLIYKSALLAFDWVYTAKPTSTESYNTMVSSVNNTTFSLTLSGEGQWSEATA